MFLNERMPLAVVLGTYPACRVAVTISLYSTPLSIYSYTIFHHVSSSVQVMDLDLESKFIPFHIINLSNLN